MLRKKISEPLLVKVIRIITASVFIFSAVVKGVDPFGTDYRVVDYLEAYGWYSLVDYSFVLSILLISAEFLLGVALLLKLKSKLASLGVLLIMIFFTLVTYFDAMYELVPDCGCFGDAVKLTNWETFYKNIVLLGFAIIIFLSRSKLGVRLHQWAQLVLLIIILGVFDLFIYYNYNHLPVIDFRAWEVGNDMKSSGKETVVNYLVYKNMSTGELKEYVSPNYPWNDSVWMSEWEFVNQRIDDSKLVLKHGLVIEDESGNNLTEELIENPDYQLLLTVYDIEKANMQGLLEASNLYSELEDVNFALVTSSTIEELENYRELYNINYNIYFGDDIELKAMIRSNPGMILLKDGIVIQKWHYNDFPDIEKVVELTSK
mgnify:FL=1